MARLSFLTYLRGIYNMNLSSTSEVHSAIIRSIYDCFIMAKGDIDYMKLEMCLATATGYWLDCWGDYFSVYRKVDEPDEIYSRRIIASVAQPKSTIPAIKDNLVSYMNYEYGTNYSREDVLIKEPWKSLSKYSHTGALSSDARFFSGDYYSHAVIDISIPEEVTTGIIELTNSIKAAGVKVMWSILNSYDIVSEFNTADDAWASYHRWIQTQVDRKQYSGLVLSNSSPNPMLSGKRTIWNYSSLKYHWYAKVIDKQTDDSIIITKKDLIGLLDYYTEIEKIIDSIYEDNSLVVSSSGELNEDYLSGNEYQISCVEKIIKITDELVESLELMDKMLSLSYQGRMSTSEGIMFKQLAEHKVFKLLMEELNRFKSNRPDYYNSVQPPILNGEHAMWLVERNKNWIWNTPTMSHRDFFDLWEPFDDYVEESYIIVVDGVDYYIELGGESHKFVVSTGTQLTEHTLNSIMEFEDAYYNGYITFADKYQPPIVVSDKFIWSSINDTCSLWDSQVFRFDDLRGVLRTQFNKSLGIPDNPNPSLIDIIQMEEIFTPLGYLVKRDAQPEICITSEPIINS